MTTYVYALEILVNRALDFIAYNTSVILTNMANVLSHFENESKSELKCAKLLNGDNTYFKCEGLR